MVSETREFVVDFFDDVFGVISDKTDVRIGKLKQYCKSLKKIKHGKQDGTGTVIVSLQVMDSLKYCEPSLHALIKRMNDGEIDITDDVEIIIAAFGQDNYKKGWKGSIHKFVELMQSVVAAPAEHGTNGYYTRSYHADMFDGDLTDFIILGVYVHKSEELYDTCAINLIGLPKEREEEILNKQILEMFGY